MNLVKAMTDMLNPLAYLCVLVLGGEVQRSFLLEALNCIGKEMTVLQLGDLKLVDLLVRLVALGKESNCS